MSSTVVPVGDQLLDHLPEVVAARRVEAGGGLVEEQHRRPVHERGGQVEPAAHAAGVGPRRAVGGVGEPEPLEQLVGPRPASRSAREVGEAADQPQVLAAGEVLVDGRVLPGQADARAHARSAVAHHVEAQHRGLARVGLEDGREDAHGGGLAGAVGPEQAEHGAGGHREVDAVEGDDVAEALHESARLIAGCDSDVLAPRFGLLLPILDIIDLLHAVKGSEGRLTCPR